jgi:predicted DNA-binding ribbon-helix-helix protein
MTISHPMPFSAHVHPGEGRYRLSSLMKRSFSLAGHRTSVALEPEFWAALDAIARRRGQSLSALIGGVDAERGAERPLASALRLMALREAEARPE